MPRSRAPHVRQGPSSIEAPECEPFATANTESNLSTLGLSHFPQSTLAVEEVTILSNRVPQSWHLYSKIGMSFPLLQYNECQPTFQRFSLNHSRIFSGPSRCGNQNSRLTRPGLLLKVSVGHINLGVYH